MAGLTRRDLFKSSAAVTAARVVPPAHAARRRPKAHKPVAPKTAAPSARERLLLDFGWRFHLGHACDQDKDFGFGLNQRTFSKAGAGVATAAAMLDFDDSGWAQVNLPHDWAVELPFTPSKNPPPAGEDDPRAAHGFKPLGREYPENQRRLVPARLRSAGVRSGAAACRSSSTASSATALVMFNGYIVARHGDGYTPFPRRHQRFRQLRRQERRSPSAWTPRWAKAGSTRARGFTAMSGWSRPIPCTFRNGAVGSEARSRAPWRR